nr:ABC transporter [Theileria orientalis]
MVVSCKYILLKLINSSKNGQYGYLESLVCVNSACEDAISGSAIYKNFNKYFIPPGHKLKFDKCLNIHEEYVVNPANKDVREPDKKQLLRRRAIEFKADSKKFFCLKRLFYRPKLTIVDVGHYLTAEHSGVS